MTKIYKEKISITLGEKLTKALALHRDKTPIPEQTIVSLVMAIAGLPLLNKEKDFKKRYNQINKVIKRIEAKSRIKKA